MKLREWAWAPALIAAGILLPGLTAPPAQAMPPEQAYIATLDHFGVYYSSEDAAIAAGYSVCDALDHGAAIGSLVRVAQLSGGYSRVDAETIVGASVGALCQEYMPLIDSPAAAPMQRRLV